MLVSKILGPVWCDHRQTFFPHVKIMRKESSKQVLAVPCGWTSLSTWKLLPHVVQVLPPSPADSTALQPPRAPAEAASLSPSPSTLPSTGEQQGVNMYSTCEGIWLLSPWLAGVLWGSGWRVGAVHAAVSRVRGTAVSPEHVFTLSGEEGMHRMFSSTLQPSGSARKGSFQLV